MKNEFELGRILAEMYDKAPAGYKVANIHLFGIKYADEISNNRISIAEILKVAKMNPSYATEISKGIKLSRYVAIK